MMTQKRTYSALFVVLLICCSCSTIDTSKFDAFKKSVENLNTSSSSVLTSVEKISRDSGIRKLSQGQEVKPSELRLEIKDFDWRLDKPPVYLNFRRAKIQLAKLNSLLMEYAELVGQVAGSVITKPGTFNELAKDLNKNTQELHQTLGGDDDSKKFGLLSSGAISAFEAFMNSKRTKLLNKAVKENQSYVESHVQLMVGLVDIMKGTVEKAYNDKFTKLNIQWVKASNKDAVSREIYDLNDELIADFERLELLKSSFNALPGLHKGLSKKNDGSFSSRVRGIEYSVKRFQEIQKNQKE